MRLFAAVIPERRYARGVPDRIRTKRRTPAKTRKREGATVRGPTVACHRPEAGRAQISGVTRAHSAPSLLLTMRFVGTDALSWEIERGLRRHDPSGG